jgi:hypothetical protein
MDTALRAAEQGKWEGFYHRGDWFLFVPYTRALLVALERQLQGEPLPLDTILHWQPFDPYARIKAYQDGQTVPF